MPTVIIAVPTVTNTFGAAANVSGLAGANRTFLFSGTVGDEVFLYGSLDNATYVRLDGSFTGEGDVSVENQNVNFYKAYRFRGTTACVLQVAAEEPFSFSFTASAIEYSPAQGGAYPASPPDQVASALDYLASSFCYVFGADASTGDDLTMIIPPGSSLVTVPPSSAPDPNPRIIVPRDGAFHRFAGEFVGDEANIGITAIADLMLDGVSVAQATGLDCTAAAPGWIVDINPNIATATGSRVSVRITTSGILTQPITAISATAC